MTLSTNQPSRLVVDSNVWISALVFGGQTRKVFERIVQNGDDLIVSEAIYSEVRRILHRKFPEFVLDFEGLLVALLPRIIKVELGSITIEVCRDPNDNLVLETAVIGRTTVIVSGDKDLLVLKTYQGIHILTPQQHNSEAGKR
jgi:hypothetical protein